MVVNNETSGKELKYGDLIEYHELISFECMIILIFGLMTNLFRNEVRIIIQAFQFRHSFLRRDPNSVIGRNSRRTSR